MPEYAKTQFKKIVGSRIQVWEGVAKETSGGLKKKDLMISKSGTVVSKKASQAAKNRMKSLKYSQQDLKHFLVQPTLQFLLKTQI